MASRNVEMRETARAVTVLVECLESWHFVCATENFVDSAEARLRER